MKPFIFLLAVLTVLAGPLWAQDSVEKPLPLDGSIAANGKRVELRWDQAQPPRVGAVIVNRRLLGEQGATSWQALGPALGPVLSFEDDTTEPGIAYEYQVMRTARDIVDAGYWATGVDLPAVVARGTAHVVVDQTVAGPLAAHLDRFERDLIGDGWQVVRHDSPRGDLANPVRNLTAAVSVKTWLTAQYHEDPFGQHAVVLVGHVPIVLSGQARPDGHGAVPHATDLFYAEVDGQWRATPEGLLLENRLPSDVIEMQVGRIDFANLTAGDPAREVALLRAYFDKNHHWRQGMIGDLRGAYGQSKHLLAEQYELRNIVGPPAVQSGGHHDIGQQRPWLWGVDFGEASGKIYATDFANKAVFAINFGSHKQKIERPFNAMTALLAQPWYPVAVGWGGRPTWRLHIMALGDTIGEVHRRTVNNGRAETPYRETMDYYPTGNYLWRNPIWVNLLGDPTLRAFMLAPASQVVAEETGEGLRVSWAASPDPDVTGYRVWRAAAAGAPFVPLDGGEVISGLSVLDSAPVPEARYMVRAYGLKDVYAGSLHTLSQGAFSAPEGPLPQAPALEVRTGKDQPLALPEMFDAPQDGLIHAIIAGPQTGTLAQTEAGWIYTPPAGFSGTVTLGVSVSDRWRTEPGRMTLTIGE